MRTEDVALRRVEEAGRLLERAESVSEIREVMAVAEAVRVYAKRVGAGRKVEQRIGEWVVRAERKLGKVLGGMEKAKGRAGPGRGKAGKRAKPALPDAAPTLKAQGISKGLSSRSQRLARMTDEVFEEKLAEVKAVGEVSPTAMVKAQVVHVSLNSGENEWYTPGEFIEAAKGVMGGIDTDPASSQKANETVGAGEYFDLETDGLKQVWGERVWLNPPYGQPWVSQFTGLLADKVKLGEVKEACVLVNNATETGWFQEMLATAKAVCLVKGRIKYLDRTGQPKYSPLQGQAIVYFGNRREKFMGEFSELGVVLWVA